MSEKTRLCNWCQHWNDKSNKFCSNCGKPLKKFNEYSELEQARHLMLRKKEYRTKHDDVIDELIRKYRREENK